jgi:hypothetical protein
MGLLEWGISPSQGRYLHTGQHKHRINAHRHPCLEWDSNPRHPSVRTVEDSSCPRACGHCDWQHDQSPTQNLKIYATMVVVVVVMIKITIRFESGNTFGWYTNNFVLEISTNWMQTVGTLPQLFIPINTVVKYLDSCGWTVGTHTNRYLDRYHNMATALIRKTKFRNTLLQNLWKHSSAK